MHDAFPVHNDFDFVRLHPEKVHRLYDFESFVEEGRRIYRDLFAHIPYGMVERVACRDLI